MNAELNKSQTNLIKWLNAILDNNSSIEYLKSNVDFQNLILKEIYALNLLSTKDLTIKNDYETIVKKYNSICPSNTFNFESSSQKVADADIEDTIHYLPVYFKNIFHFDIDNLNSSTSVQAANNQTQNASVNQQGFGFNSDNITIPNPALIQRARQNINDKIINDQVQIFSSYPKYYPYLKMALGCAMCLLSLSLLIYSILLFTLHGKDSGYITTRDGATYYYNMLTVGLPSILFVGFLLYSAYTILKPFFFKGNISKKPSKNLIFQFPNVIGWIVLASVLMTVFETWPDSRIPDPIFRYHVKALLVNQDTISAACTIQIISLSILGIVVALTFALFLLKPKQDYGKINQMLQAELSGIQNTMNNSTNPTVVSPIEQKEPEQKPTETSQANN